MTINPILRLGRSIAKSWPAIGDFEQAVMHMAEDCKLLGIVEPERRVVVGALLMGYLLNGKARRAAK